MESYNDFYQIIGEKLKYDKYIGAVEECIKLITIFNEEKICYLKKSSKIIALYLLMMK